MDHGSHQMVGLRSDISHAFARDYWYISAGVVGLLVAIRGVNSYAASQRLKACRDPNVPNPTRPDGHLSQAWATATAIIREMSHPQAYVRARGFTWATPPPIGRILVLLSYWAMIIYFMSWNAVHDDVYYWERIGYRNAWVTMTQLPMMYMLSMKANPIGFLIGTGHERLNWLHRWVARTMFVTATVHGFHFWTEWVRADFVATQLEMMPLVKFGLGAWGILLWSVVVGFLPIRRLWYELWLLQHVASSIVMLVVLYRHIPSNARYLLWMSISFLAFDRAARWAILLWQNVWWKSNGSTCQGQQHIGHRVSARAVGDSTTVLTIKDAHFKWTAGQHIYLWIPRLGPLEAHPYTIACAHQLKGTCCCNSIQLIVRKHAGFSKRVHDYASKNPNATLTGFLSGPYGVPPRWDIYETMVLIGASTGASFTIPILESAARAESKACVKRIDVVLISKTAKEIEYYVQRAKDAEKVAREKGMDVRLHIAITGGSSLRDSNLPLIQSQNEGKFDSIEPADSFETSSHEKPRAVNDASSRPTSQCSASESIREYTSRPDIETLIREPVEQAWGETAVVVCGGAEVVARTRNCVSRLSDERAVHKGTGAQGICLHVEEYAF